MQNYLISSNKIPVPILILCRIGNCLHGYGKIKVWSRCVLNNNRSFPKIATFGCLFLYNILLFPYIQLHAISHWHLDLPIKNFYIALMKKYKDKSLKELFLSPEYFSFPQLYFVRFYGTKFILMGWRGWFFYVSFIARFCNENWAACLHIQHSNDSQNFFKVHKIQCIIKVHWLRAGVHRTCKVDVFVDHLTFQEN